jgi:glyoxylase-like metal-dependent hydrolase (beta-lactamase superfamily II)
VFVLRCKQTGEAALIDAANEHGKLLDLCKRLNVRQVLETHGHWDHIQAVPAVRDAGYEVGVTFADSHMLPSYDFVIDDGAVTNVGRLRLLAIATPGHTAGSVCFRVDGSPILFSGDTLFPGGPGATSSPGADFPTIISSIEERLFSPLPAETLVCPATAPTPRSVPSALTFKSGPTGAGNNVGFKIAARHELRDKTASYTAVFRSLRPHSEVLWK